jgi:phage terminase large subunit
VRLTLPPKLRWLFHGEAQYRAAYGGRGSAKSYTFALMLAVRGMMEPCRILCCRELMNSIKDSSFAQIKEVIRAHPELSAHYSFGESFIRGRNDTEVLFRGLRHNVEGLKGFTDANICWVDEAENVSAESWKELLPTIRKPGSETWVSWNPRRKTSATNRIFREDPMPSTKLVQVNWRDNPWFPAELELQRRHMERNDPDAYQHVWEGGFETKSAAQVLIDKWQVREFKPTRTWDGPYYGMDFGFADDPTALVRCWLFADCLWIEHAEAQQRLELDQTASWFRDRIPGVAEHVIRADSASPGTISYLKRHGLPKITGVQKWAGSVEEGVKHLRSYRRIYIHPRAKAAIEEARLWSWKQDRLSGDILPTLVDADNHTWDAVRYALAPLIRKSGVDIYKLTRT